MEYMYCHIVKISQVILTLLGLDRILLELKQRILFYVAGLLGRYFSYTSTNLGKFFVWSMEESLHCQINVLLSMLLERFSNTAQFMPQSIKGKRNNFTHGFLSPFYKGWWVIYYNISVDMFAISGSATKLG